MKHDNCFSFLHILAALFVIFGHQYVLMGQFPVTLMGIDIHGLGLRVLFIVSGYLISASFLNSNSVKS